MITDTSIHLGPDLARELARRDHDLVIGEPADGLVAELEAFGATVEALSGIADLSDPVSIQSLVATPGHATWRDLTHQLGQISPSWGNVSAGETEVGVRGRG